jgi:hypothetical protein
MRKKCRMPLLTCSPHQIREAPNAVPPIPTMLTTDQPMSFMRLNSSTVAHCDVDRAAWCWLAQATLLLPHQILSLHVPHEHSRFELGLGGRLVADGPLSEWCRPVEDRRQLLLHLLRCKASGVGQPASNGEV